MLSDGRLPTLLLSMSGVAGVVAIATLVVAGATDSLDRALLDAIRAPVLAGVLAPLGPITELGSTLAVTIVAALVMAVGLAVGPWLHGVIGAVVVGLASLATSLVKVSIARERPELVEPILLERGFSFPSGHAALGMVAYGVLAVLVTRSRLAAPVRRTIVAGLAILVVLIGVSRVWLGVHYPTDVLAGWLAGGVVVLLYARITRGVSREPAAGAVDAGRGAPRSDPPATR
jgi:undecaprenyl-diphosphatase